MLRILCLLLFGTSFSLAQQVSNGSFEGPTGSSTTPPDWRACNPYSTPDTQPGAWNVTTRPSHGKSYISLVTRGLHGEDKDNSTEAISGTFTKPLKVGMTYEFSLDLAYASNFDDLWYYPDWRPVILNVYFGTDYCDKTQLVWESPKISNTPWTTYSFLYTATTEVTFILLEADFSRVDPYNGNILVDRIVIGKSEDHGVNESTNCSLGVPNVFTPNADTFNDVFTIQHPADVQKYHLKVYDRWGKPVFESYQIDTVWDGRTQSGGEAPSGIYYWTLGCLCIEGGMIRADDLKGTVSLLR
jgi:gliding motility-associated-like protein